MHCRSRPSTPSHAAARTDRDWGSEKRTHPAALARTWSPVLQRDLCSWHAGVKDFVVERCLVARDALAPLRELLASSVLLETRRRHPLMKRALPELAALLPACSQNISTTGQPRFKQPDTGKPYIFNRHINALHFTRFTQNLIDIGPLVRVLS